MPDCHITITGTGCLGGRLSLQLEMENNESCLRLNNMLMQQLIFYVIFQLLWWSFYIVNIIELLLVILIVCCIHTHTLV